MSCALLGSTGSPTKASAPANGAVFEANEGQWDARVRFAARSGKMALLVTDEGMTMRFAGTPSAVSIALASGTSAPRGEDELGGKSNFFVGPESQWRTNVSTFSRVRSRGAGVDVVWHGGETGLEYDLEIAAGVDARELALDVEGADAMTVADDGSLEIAVAGGTLEQPPPRVVQNGREIAARYVVIDSRTVRFAFEGYDPSAPLLVDPSLAYSTYLGGALYDAPSAVAVDASGNVYVTGYTTSADFPTKAAYQSSGAAGDAFVTKLDANGAIVYSTYLGGSGVDQGLAIAVDSSGVYVAGSTTSTNFPMQGALQATNAGGTSDAFVTKLAASGASLVYSTYFGGSGTDQAAGIRVDGSGEAVVVGTTSSTDVTTKNAIQSSYGGGAQDAFVAKLAANGATLVYGTYLGGSGQDNANAVAVDAAGNAWVAGITASTDFKTQSPLQSNNGGNVDAFVTKINAAGSALVYSTYLGGSALDWASGVAVDATGNAYVTGHTQSSNFPTQSPAKPFGGTTDFFVSKLNASGASLVYSTFLGGTGDDEAQGIDVDAAGEAYVIGWSYSSDFPMVNAIQATYGGGRDAIVAKLDAAGTTFAYSTYLGGSGDDQGAAIALAQAGGAWLAGTTKSTNFPTVTPEQAQNATNGDGFVARVVDTSVATDGGVPEAGSDAAVPEAGSDAAPVADSGEPDGGNPNGGSGTCHCDVVGASPSNAPWLLSLLALGLGRRKRKAT